MGVLEETVFNVATQLRFDVLNRAADRFVRTLCVSASAACRAWSWGSAPGCVLYFVTT